MGCGILYTNGSERNKMYKVFEYTSKSLDQFTNFISNMFGNDDQNIIDFCRHEYGPDWQWAYRDIKNKRTTNLRKAG